MLEGDDSWRNKDMHVWYVLVDKMTDRITNICPATQGFLDEPPEEEYILSNASGFPRKFAGTEAQIKTLFNLK